MQNPEMTPQPVNDMARLCMSDRARIQLDLGTVSLMQLRGE
ncbi:hypothetical protein [Arthrobacter sp. N199823]|nr:hypothetical protein [Arthrobacter sp. N199823]